MRILQAAAILIVAITPIAILRSNPTDRSLPFAPVGLSGDRHILTVCGTDLGIASSTDGIHWEVRHVIPGAGTLLAIGGPNEKRLSFAGGTGGTMLLSTDEGVSWNRVPSNFHDPILQLSFADPQHGIVVTTAEVLYTKDGGNNWHSVIPSSSLDQGRFKYVLEAAALDSSHAAVLMKSGPAQYYDGRIVATADAGTTWKINEIEHTTLNNLLVVGGEYWLVGTEVIDRENHGGHAVPVTFHSSDGLEWVRGPKPPIDVNNVCRPEGCLMWNGAGFDPFVGKGKIFTFDPMSNLSTQWSATDVRICSLVPELQCGDVHNSEVLPKRAGPAPFLAATLLRPTTSDSAGKCIRCDYPHFLISNTFSGKADVDLTVYARPDGTVSSVEVSNAPTADVGSEVERAARNWFFYPVLKDGVPSATKRNIKVTVNVIKRD